MMVIALNICCVMLLMRMLIMMIMIMMLIFMTGRKLLSLLSDFRLSTIHWLEGVDDAGTIDSPTILQIAWSIAYSYHSSGRPLLKDFYHDDDGEEDDDDDEVDVTHVNRVEKVYKTMQAIHTITHNATSLNDHHNQPDSSDQQLHSNHNHPQIKTVDVKRLQSTVEDIVLHVFFAGTISDEINDEVTNGVSDDVVDVMEMMAVLKLLDYCCIDFAPFDGGSS